jgi:hypothetical protein
MKLERLLRSPLINAVLFILLGAALMLMHYGEYVPKWLLLAMMTVIVVYAAVWTALVMFHNRRHPQRRIHLNSCIPPEYREEDEGQQWMNYRVTRRVYMLYYSAVPVLLALIVIFPDGKAAAIAGLSILAAAQQMMYWWELRKWERY